MIVVSLPMVGYPFTWERGRGTREWVDERLDRVVADLRWGEVSDNARVEVGAFALKMLGY